jgi:hypothetical protein
MSAYKHSSSRDAWIIAWALTFLLHALAIVGMRHFSPIGRASATRPAQPEPIQLVFSPPTPKPSQDAKPNFFSELPPDRKDVAPKHADFLSNVTSRARDQVPGGDAALPRMRGEGDAPMVALEPNGGSSHPATSSPVPPPPSPPLTTPRPSTTSPGFSAAPSMALPTATKGVGGPAAPAQRHDAGPTAQSPDDQASLFGYAGRSDMHQPQMDNPQGNASLTGDVSLNTTQWDYAPWLQRFGRRLMQTWFAPEAYYLGVLKEGGWAVIELEIAPSGQLLRLDLLEEQGHPSLIRAATSAVRGMAPYERLPADFPEKTLVLRIRMIYPKFRR